MRSQFRELIDKEQDKGKSWFQPIHGLGFEVVPISPTSLFDIPLSSLEETPFMDISSRRTCKSLVATMILWEEIPVPHTVPRAAKLGQAMQEFGSMVQQLGKLATEPGLDVQNYTCKGCGHPIGINFAKARMSVMWRYNPCGGTPLGFCRMCGRYRGGICRLKNGPRHIPTRHDLEAECDCECYCRRYLPLV
uniref:Uncharacterized protein n=1 Tax=Timema genevievae TaxID=629358 RepID=A0A7R9K8G3_TIMGE|nr:unnamed protein product [Timema genevievae]